MIHYLDTQVVVWLCEARLDRLSARARRLIEDHDLAISPMVLLELEYLFEIKRIVTPPLALMNGLTAQMPVATRDGGFAAIVHTALFETWTRDPFDRGIVAHAKSDGFAPLVTSDSTILKHYSGALW